MRPMLFVVLALAGTSSQQAWAAPTSAMLVAQEPVRAVPERVLKVLRYVDEHKEAPPGYEGGRTFGNFENRLRQTDGRGQRIRYREWDVHPRRPGVNRGAERLVTGSEGSAYYTDDHYRSFTKIR
jgi:guanyl-specific ribonuclease Sa